ncbi:MAG: hypothetical protein C0501_20415 [Isosphaera sp.]|nr:hypothetical protein [Isosphaera sp.]
MFVFVRCVAAAVAEVGVRGLVGLVPGGEYACKVADAAWRKYRERQRDDGLRDDVRRMAEAAFDEAKWAGAEAAREEAARHSLPDADAQNLELFLTQIPAAVRASLKRPDDPTGRSVPAAFALRSADDVLRLLPPRLPRFRPGDALPGGPGWVLEEQIGAGGFGEVWLARYGDAGRSNIVGAVKFCHGLEVRDLRHELDVVTRVMAAGRHPGVVPVLAQHLDGDAPWVMYEYVPDGDLADRIREWAALPAGERVPRVVAALKVLAEDVGRWHRLSPAVVHRDLKPSNVLFDAPAGRFRVTDFGIGGVSAREALRAETTGQSSRGGRLLSYLRGSHTPLYSSPQQRDGSDPDPRDDVHALGVIAYQMLTGHLAQGCGTDFEDDLTESGADGELIRVLKRCTAQRPDRRPADAAELAAELARLGPAVAPTGPAAAPPQTHARRREAEAHHALGLKYYLGDGVTQDCAEAMRWFREAADLGHADAQYRLGWGYCLGLGVSRDYAEAVRWCRRAADQNHVGAQAQLGVLYADGLGVTKNLVTAGEWFRRAAAQGDETAKNELRKLGAG